MILKKSAFRDAPPIKPPSMSGCARRSFALDPFILPPYWMRIALATSALICSFTYSRMEACVSCANSGVAVKPVPIAHTVMINCRSEKYARFKCIVYIYSYCLSYLVHRQYSHLPNPFHSINLLQAQVVLRIRPL